MPAWTEEATFPQPVSDPAAPPPAAPEALSIAGVPWVTIGLLLSAVWVMVAAGGLRSGVALPSLLIYGAKATPLILDRGETWRLFAANLLHKDALHLAFNAFALWNVGGALERAVRPADYLALLIFTALGTTLVSAIGADSISLGKHLWWRGPVAVAVKAIHGRRFTFGRHEGGAPKKTNRLRGDATFPVDNYFYRTVIIIKVLGVDFRSGNCSEAISRAMRGAWDCRDPSAAGALRGDAGHGWASQP